jgi:Flp pilus assembly protein TadG
MSGLLPRLANALRSDRRGSALVEFAIIGPAMILMLLGVTQTGIQMQNYNAVRNLASDGSRFAAVEYQKGTRSTPEAIETWMFARAVSNTYNLDIDRLDITVTEATTSRLTGLVEMNITVSYDATEVLWTVAGDALAISYSRAVFLPPAPTPTPSPSAAP